ncbi:hypothetical protein ACLMJK_000832 [Lecanora helva]
MAVVMGVSNEAVSNIHPFFKAKTNPSLDSDFDQNDSRRKRQRTVASEDLARSIEPSTSGSWVDQLRVAAWSDFGPSTQVEMDDHPDQPTTQEPRMSKSRDVAVQGKIDGDTDASPAVNTDQFRSNLARSPDEDSEPRPSKNSLEDFPNNDLNPPEMSGATHCTTPPRKMLRVRPDGKLGSPKAKGASKDTKSRRSKKSATSQLVPGHLVTTIKYGTDSASRVSVGSKIDSILLGIGSKSIFETSSHARPNEPLKATHPFFLGGVNRKIGSRKNSISSEDQKKPVTNVTSPLPKRTDVNLKNSRIISKPANPDPISARGAPFHWNAFGSDHARVTRFPGATNPSWPPQDMFHIGRGPEPLVAELDHLQDFYASNTSSKLKGTEVKIQAEDEVLRPFVDLVRSFKFDSRFSQRVTSRELRQFRRPLRRLMTGTALQTAVRQRMGNLSYDLVHDSNEDQMNDELSLSPQVSQLNAHKALESVYNAVATSLTAFDKFQCETLEWVHKYSPKTAEEVLQPGREVMMLRDWLEGLETNVVEIRTAQSRESSISRNVGIKTTRRKRRRADTLDDFVVSSDEEASQMDEIVDTKERHFIDSTTKRSVIRREDVPRISRAGNRSANAVVISGPHGSGKTAAVYAVAQELGFEVFEINSGSRRSGRDILDKVGDMSRNHLVRHAPAEDPASSRDPQEESDFNSHDVEKDIESGRQRVMNSFFRVKSTEKNVQSGKAKTSRALPKKEQASRPAKSQKQSLILLEEVDVLFEEDKMFWSTTLSLILQSKRPVIMTCTDEQLLPIDEMLLYAILRFTSPPVQLATDYLMLVACNEGHLLSAQAVSALYKGKGLDLRASIAELNFFCQMAIGDTKGGLDWMLIPTAGDSLQNIESVLRVVSEDTYQTAMGWLGGEKCPSDANMSLLQETELLSEVWNGWGIDIGAFEECQEADAIDCPRGASSRNDIKMLEEYELGMDALSAADTFPACISREPEMVWLDKDIPYMSDSMRSNYTDGSELLLADPVIDQNGVTDSIVLTLRACVRRLSCEPKISSNVNLNDDESLACAIPKIIQKCSERIPASVLAAFEPIARATSTTLGIPRGPQIMSFDSTRSVLFVDLAPYIRSIVSYDRRLEEQRRQLDLQLSGPCRDGKKARTTRSSRAALEGGQKAYTRRERWFPNHTNFDMILRSGGVDWQHALLQVMMEFERSAEMDKNDLSKTSIQGTA